MRAQNSEEWSAEFDVELGELGDVGGWTSAWGAELDVELGLGLDPRGARTTETRASTASSSSSR